MSALAALKPPRLSGRVTACYPTRRCSAVVGGEARADGALVGCPLFLLRAPVVPRVRSPAAMVRRPSPGSAATGETRRFRPFAAPSAKPVERPFAALQVRPCERAESGRKRTFARTGKAFWADPGASRLRWSLIPFQLRLGVKHPAGRQKGRCHVPRIRYGCRQMRHRIGEHDRCP